MEKWIKMLALVLLFVGGLNWGLAAVGFNLVTAIFGIGTVATQIIYGLVGLSTLYLLYLKFAKKRSL